MQSVIPAIISLIFGERVIRDMRPQVKRVTAGGFSSERSQNKWKGPTYKLRALWLRIFWLSFVLESSSQPIFTAHSGTVRARSLLPLARTISQLSLRASKAVSAEMALPTSLFTGC